MDDFSIFSITNIYSLPGVNKNNEIQSGKRPLSSMVPSIITTPDGDVKMIIARHLFMGDSLQRAITVPRIHHQLYPMVLTYSHLIPDRVIHGLRVLGHVIERSEYDSSVIALVRFDNYSS
ncbi:hypothetical protein HCN44_010025 [Aphidius gifuensis]|uniref:Uncharacterized protein n=1 Tax=Aphidius gifuensis TaxID=684658 RepID=A0A834Y4J8_APHGI|nr:hypothetical protein HCN44_010025 [Aphidius gifuensis]